MANLVLDRLFAICDYVGMEHLAHYLADNGIAQRSFAVRVGCSPSYLSDILSGRRLPGLGLAARIERATGGAVKAVSWVPEEDAA